MYFVGLLIKVGSFWLASQLELTRCTTELKPKLSSFKNSNESNRATNERVASFEFFVRPYSAARASRELVHVSPFGRAPAGAAHAYAMLGLV
jgi:hypothetical protein